MRCIIDANYVVGKYLDAIGERHALLTEKLRVSKVNKWIKRFSLIMLQKLSKNEVEQLLKSITNPTVELTLDKKKQNRSNKSTDYGIFRSSEC